jgi:molybdopterin-containing oxidoreductase family membrane subunit
MNTITSINELTKDLQPRKFGLRGQLWTTLLVLIVLNGFVSYYFQLKNGLSVTDMSNYVSWGIYISNFVFFVAISLVGSLISAILKLSNAKWSIPLTRIAEIIAVANIMFAGLIIIVDMGRPDRILNLFMYGRIQSPIVWDVLVVMTYLAISILLLYIPLLPDLALLRDKMKDIPKWQHQLYKILSLGWTGTEAQYKILHKSVNGLAIVIIPVALGIHTVTSWLFASTLRGGWNSTNFGPYFVAGAFVVGAAAVISLMYIARRYYKLERYLNEDIFDKMGKLLVMLSLVYTYFTINEYLTPAFKMMEGERSLIQDLFIGGFAPMFWGVQIFGVIIPVFVMLFRKGRKPLPLFIVANMVIVGAWFKRYLIVIPTLFHPYLPAIKQNGVPSAIHYFPTWHEWSITIASLAGSMLIITILFRYLPFISMWEIAEEQHIELDPIIPAVEKSKN